MPRIVENPSSKDLLDQIQALEWLGSLFAAIPFATRIFPNAAEIFAQVQDLKKKTDLFTLPDRFNDAFSRG